ncbi:MAG TPA: penicillin acylase family protein, partial [bacterium]|nr:penicillin acylase family protein [bacterium]
MRTTLRNASLILTALAVLAAVGAACGPGGHKSRVHIEDVPVTQKLTLTGLSSQVDILRDEYGRPHVYAHDPIDAARASGWLQAEDRMIQLDLLRRLGSGTLAELVGAVAPEAAQEDAYLRAVGLRRAAQESYDAAPQYEKDLAQAYADGVNAKIATFTTFPAPEYAVFGVLPADIEPWTPLDSLVVSKVFAFNLNWDGGTELALADGKERLDAAFPTGPRAGSTADLIFPFLPPETVSIVNPSLAGSMVMQLVRPEITWNARPSRASLEGARHTAWQLEHSRWNPFGKKKGVFGDRGSNNWVVSGAKTASGHPIVCNDPHLSLDAPPIWYPMHLNTEKYGGSLNVEGVSVVGAPGVTLGGNGKVAWAFTNTNPDTTDVYLEKYSLGTGTNGVDQVMWDADGPGGAAPALVNLVKD